MTRNRINIEDTLRKQWYYFIYKPDSTELYWGKIIPSILVFAGFGVWFYFNQTRVERLKKERNDFAYFTIGVTTSSNNNVKGSRTVNYFYTVNGKNYTNWNSWSMLDNSIVVKGGRYYVKFASINPSNSEMLFSYPVPSSIVNIPLNGWEHLPNGR